jgi:hypothetical protein
MRENKNGYRVMREQTEEKRPLGEHKRRGENRVKIDFK